MQLMYPTVQNDPSRNLGNETKKTATWNFTKCAGCVWMGWRIAVQRRLNEDDVHRAAPVSALVFQHVDKIQLLHAVYLHGWSSCSRRWWSWSEKKREGERKTTNKCRRCESALQRGGWGERSSHVVYPVDCERSEEHSSSAGESLVTTAASLLGFLCA